MQPVKSRWTRVCSLLGAVFFLVACASADFTGSGQDSASDTTGSSLEPTTAKDTPPAAVVIEDEASLQTGDVIAGMTVESVGPLKEAPAGLQNVRIVFSGTKTVTGRYVYHGENTLVPNQISITVDQAPGVLPVLAGDKDEQTFVFTNPGLAQELFGPPGSFGEATVVINGYTLERFPAGSASNRAELVEVLAINQQTQAGDK